MCIIGKLAFYGFFWFRKLNFLLSGVLLSLYCCLGFLNLHHHLQKLVLLAIHQVFSVRCLGQFCHPQKNFDISQGWAITKMDSLRYVPLCLTSTYLCSHPLIVPNPVGWGCRIHRLYLHRGVRLLLSVSWI